MKLKKIIGGVCALLLAVFLSGFIKLDDDQIQKVIAQLNKWVDRNPFEKVYLHLDKPYYAIGDDVWFKAYVTVGGQNHLSNMSQVLNVELINDADSVKRSIKLKLSAGTAWGDFALPDTLQEGSYRIRAYTNYMRNAGEEYYFDKQVIIVNSFSNVFTKTSYTADNQNGQQKINAFINYTDAGGTAYVKKEVGYEVKSGAKIIVRGKTMTDDNGNMNVSFAGISPLNSQRIITVLKIRDKQSVTKSIPVQLQSNNVDVQFFPEGGNLVNDISTKVAFKAVGSDGLGVAVKGVVTNDENHVIADFTTQHAGMGAFNMRPESGHNYKAHITYADGTQNDMNLPAATDKGYVISIVNDDPYRVRLQIVASKAQMAADPTGVVSVIAQAGGIVCYAGKSNPGDASLKASIPKTKIPPGILHFTLFSSSGEPINERLIFIRNPDQLRVEASGIKSTYAPREKVKIDLAVNKQDSPVTGVFSVAVTDETKVPVDENNESTILSNLLLTSDLKGYIEKPNYYFNNVSPEKDADLDLLMLTQGYRRFEWKQILSDVFQPVVFQPQKSLEITGHIKTLGGKPIPHGKVTLLSTAGGFFIVDTIADENGKFVFNNLIFKDSVKFAIQARTEKDRKNVDIELDNIPDRFVSKSKNENSVQVNLTTGLTPFLQSSKDLYNEQAKYGLGNHTLMLKEVTIHEKREQAFKNSSNLNGPGSADQALSGSQFIQGCAFITDCLQGRLLGVSFRNGVPYSNRSLNRPMQLIIDGVFVDSTFLTGLSPQDIESVEVLNSVMYTSIYGGRGASGILIITTKRGSSTSNYQHFAPGIISFYPKGYYKSRVFYSPQYDDPKTNKFIPDLRSTIYWNPNVISDKDGKASFSYFNADGKGTYRVVIEGMDADGDLIRQIHRYKVE